MAWQDDPIVQKTTGWQSDPVVKKAEAGFGEQMNAAIKELPRQAGLTARHLIQGVADTAGILANPLAMGVNAIIGPRKQTLSDLIDGKPQEPVITMPTQAVSNLMDRIGFPSPSTPTERVVGDASRMLAGGGAMIKTANVAAQGAGTLGRSIAESLAARPGMQAASATGAGAAGGYTRETGGDGKDQFIASIIGGLAAPAGMAGARGLATSGRMVKSAISDPLVNHNAILGNTLVRDVGMDNISSITNSLVKSPRTPGVNFSVGQRTGNPSISAFEDTLRAINPGGELNAQAISNNTALANTMRGIAKDDMAVEAAKQARKTAATPLYEAAKKSQNLADPSRTVSLIDRIVKQSPANKALVDPMNAIRESLFEAYPLQQRGSDAWKALDGVMGSRMSSADFSAVQTARTVMDRARKGTIDAGEALSQIKSLSATSKTANAAIDTAKQYMQTPDYVLMQKPHQIMSAIDNIKAMIGKPDNSFVVGQLNTIKKSLEHQLSKAAPEFRQAEKTFAQMSRPINQMQTGQLLANKLIPSTASEIPSRLNAASLATALRNPDQVAKTATGFKRAKLDRLMEPDQVSKISGVNEDASRIADINALGAGYGSPTARRQSINNFIGENFSSQFPITSNVFGALGKVPIANIPLKAAGSAANLMGGKINQRMAAELESMLANNPDMIKKLLLDAQRRNASLLQAKKPPFVPLSALLLPGLLSKDGGN